MDMNDLNKALSYRAQRPISALELACDGFMPPMVSYRNKFCPVTGRSELDAKRDADGDGIYEVVPVYAGRPFRFAQHMARLQRSLQHVRIELAMTATDLLGVATNLLAAHADYMRASGQFNPQMAQMVYFQVTRGVARRDHDLTP